LLKKRRKNLGVHFFLPHPVGLQENSRNTVYCKLVKRMTTLKKTQWCRNISKQYIRRCDNVSVTAVRQRKQTL